MKLIYRIKDQVIVGAVYSPQDEAVEILNVTRSELGGVVGDYATVDAPAKSATQKFTVDASGKVVLVRDTVAEDKETARTTAKTKLVALGFDQNEIAVITGG